MLFKKKEKKKKKKEECDFFDFFFRFLVVLRGKQHKLTNGLKKKVGRKSISESDISLRLYSGLFYLHTVTFVMLNLSNCPFFLCGIRATQKAHFHFMH